MLKATRIKENAGRPSTLLENGIVRVLINDKGGMTPEFSIKTEAGYLNTHWVPYFRANSTEPYSEEKHADFWETELLYSISGAFPCSPSFGPQHFDNSIWLPTHGWAANSLWKHQKSGTDRKNRAAYAVATMDAPEEKFPLAMKKVDLVIESQPVYYTSLRMYNNGDEPLEVNIGYHNTVGSPFLQTGCIISLCADRFATPPLGGEFDETGRLAIGAEFESLKKAPLRDGTFADISVIPSMNGYSDFVCGRIPMDIKTGWSSVANPEAKLAYVCFFNGERNVAEDEIALHFNDLWLQFGGRNFTPWASYKGAPDCTFCLATENAIGAYATGLHNAKVVKRVLDTPTTFFIDPHSSKVLYYATALVKYENGVLDDGVTDVRIEGSKLVMSGALSEVTLDADVTFKALHSIDAMEI